MVEMNDSVLQMGFLQVFWFLPPKKHLKKKKKKQLHTVFISLKIDP